MTPSPTVVSHSSRRGGFPAAGRPGERCAGRAALGFPVLALRPLLRLGVAGCSTSELCEPPAMSAPSPLSLSSWSSPEGRDRLRARFARRRAAAALGDAGRLCDCLVVRNGSGRGAAELPLLGLAWAELLVTRPPPILGAVQGTAAPAGRHRAPGAWRGRNSQRAVAGDVASTGAVATSLRVLMATAMGCAHQRFLNCNVKKFTLRIPGTEGLRKCDVFFFFLGGGGGAPGLRGMMTAGRRSTSTIVKAGRSTEPPAIETLTGVVGRESAAGPALVTQAAAVPGYSA